MNYLQSFHPDCVRTNLSFSTKKEVLREIARMANKRIPEYSEKQLYRALDDRERAGSTGFEEGVALPHCALEDVEGFHAGILIAKDGVPFDSIDGSDSKIFFFIFGPTSERGEHVQLLSAISRISVDEEFRSAALSSQNNDELYAAVADAFEKIQPKEEAEDTRSKTLVHLFVQRSEYFERLLNLFNTAVPASVCVVEGQNAGAYLTRMPLFASFWSQGGEAEFRLITAIIDSDLQNELIRRIKLIVPDIDTEPGVLIVTSPLAFAAGSLES